MNYDNRYQLERFAKTEEQFNSFYDKELSEKITGLQKQNENLEPLRKKAKHANTGLVINAIVMFFLSVATPFTGLIFVIGSAVAIALFVAMIIPYLREMMKLEHAVKKEVIQEIVGFLNPNYTYEPDKHISEQEFLNAELFSRRADEFRGDDLIKGYVEDSQSGYRTDLSFSEIEAVEVNTTRDSKGNKKTTRTTFFKGLMFVVDFNKNFGDTMTQVVPNRMTLLGNKKEAGQVSKKSDLKQIDIEHPLFNEHFYVRSNDEVMSRVILQMDFIEKLLAFTTQEGVVARGNLEDNIYISFKDGKMYLLMNTKKDHFAIGMKTIDPELAREFFEDVNLSLELIDELNLNLQIYNKN